MMYSKEQVDYLHDTLIDLLVSCMKSGVSIEEPNIGDWCFEYTTFGDRNRDCCIGQLLKNKGNGEYVTRTIGGKEITWHNAEMAKIPSKFLRK